MASAPTMGRHGADMCCSVRTATDTDGAR